MTVDIRRQAVDARWMRNAFGVPAYVGAQSITCIDKQRGLVFQLAIDSACTGIRDRIERKAERHCIYQWGRLRVYTYLGPDMIVAMCSTPSERRVAVVLGIVYDIARELVALFCRGIVHGDVKPDNIIVPDGLPATLIDYGSATMDGVGHAGGGCTEEYLPTHTTREQHFNDIYALGHDEKLAQHLLDTYALGHAAELALRGFAIPQAASSVISEAKSLRHCAKAVALAAEKTLRGQ